MFNTTPFFEQSVYTVIVLRIKRSPDKILVLPFKFFKAFFLLVIPSMIRFYIHSFFCLFDINLLKYFVIVRMCEHLFIRIYILFIPVFN